MSDRELNIDFLTELSAEPPLIPQDYGKGKKHGQSKKLKYNGLGWKFYLSIKDKLPEWWDEFNGTLGKDTGPKYKNIRSFVKAKVKNTKQQKWLFLMLGPAPLQTEQLEVPWLGDWFKVRRNGYWNIDSKYEIKRLQRLVDKNLEASQSIKELLPFTLRDLMRVERLQQKIDDKFMGEPFLNGHPISSGNKRRFRTYVKMHTMLIDLKEKLQRQIMRIQGIDPNNPHQMHDMALLAQLSGGIGASAALAGFNAGNKVNGNLLPEPQDDKLTRDTILLATTLKRHEANFKKTLPDLELNGDELIEKNKDKNDKHKERSLQ